MPFVFIFGVIGYNLIEMRRRGSAPWAIPFDARWTTACAGRIRFLDIDVLNKIEMRRHCERKVFVRRFSITRLSEHGFNLIRHPITMSAPLTRIEPAPRRQNPPHLALGKLSNLKPSLHPVPDGREKA